MKIEIKEILDANTVRITTPDERWYQHPETKEWLPSSTWISGYVPSKELAIWMAKVGYDEAERIKKERGEKGWRVHKGIELLALGQEVFHNDTFPDADGEQGELSAEEYEAIVSFYDWAKEVKPKFMKTEHTVFNKKIGYAGTLDCIAEINGGVYIIDFKTSKEVYLSHEVQISSYKHCDGIYNRSKIAILQIGYGKNKKGYKFTEIDDKFNLFLTLKRVYDIDISKPEGEQQTATDFARVYVAKNSVAVSRQIIPMQVDWTRGYWIDRKVDVKHIQLNEEF